MPVKTKTKGLASDAKATRSDAELVRACLRHSKEDWNLLVDKYKNLIFSIPIRYGCSRDEAADIFQAVCLDLIQELPKLRDPKALPKWLMQVTAHKCFQWKRHNHRLVSQDDDSAEIPEASVPAEVESALHEVEEEQKLRDSLADMAPRCRELIHMLFYEEPKRPYQEVASSLGLATGSIGLLRQKCLDRLRKRLIEAGFS
ncbi:MAG TPA: sigma-70 family RNA polymerase sigma factor [Candidatus Sulfotelmatobacter sp.]|nr:sigma-70 family RNA polymerase sigma factor [Candidatus Sulfotelmatobacter sp.]